MKRIAIAMLFFVTGWLAQAASAASENQSAAESPKPVDEKRAATAEVVVRGTLTADAAGPGRGGWPTFTMSVSQVFKTPKDVKIEVGQKLTVKTIKELKGPVTLYLVFDKDQKLYRLQDPFGERGFSHVEASGKQSKEEFRFEELLSKALVVPEGVVYKKAAAEVNRKALEKLSQGVLAKDRKVASDELFDEVLICGPGLWRNIKDDAEMKKITTGITNIRVPTSKGTQKLEGKLFQGKEEVATFWKTFLLKYKFDGQSAIRRPTGQELQLYWAMIPYDITEPIFMIESKDATILAQFTDKDVKIGWIDDYKDLRLKDKP